MMLSLCKVMLSTVACCRKQHPELSKNLTEFQQHLKNSLEELAPLKVWQLQGKSVTVSLVHTPVVHNILLAAHTAEILHDFSGF